MTKPTIGILGGMGPAATILLQQRVLDAVQAETDADHIPLVIDMNPQVPSRIDYLIHKRGENPGPVLAHMAQRLEALGVRAIAMPCCTAHHFAPDITGTSSVPLLNMVDLTAQAIAHALPKGSWVGILASPANQQTKLFDKALGRHGLIPLYPKDSARVLASIERIKAKGAGPSEIDEVQSIAAELVDEGADCLLIGCSEFSLLSRRMVTDVQSFDALDVLTDAIIGFLHRSAVKA
ncbi:cysteate racemase [Litoreibacter albidus]|uniref:aspartate/glutamate racemase family protein n=1 Tax=Litoreibacter albidus TaxID=670155 RepID=UPI0037361E7B